MALTMVCIDRALPWLLSLSTLPSILFFLSLTFRSSSVSLSSSASLLPLLYLFCTFVPLSFLSPLPPCFESLRRHPWQVILVRERIVKKKQNKKKAVKKDQ
ncbi:hypothetical protein K457DRAFT_802393 [Linnemannia elongata AG-77]|uniref:Transmembrane protein n=1 Tax=Linnemannia elongata AG-77 TaxID=1314771 RepID=A0A197JJZ5_9FUNG|nr:hypothetical protein K457DRAFT_802393 [Linnemannia elongata AG-77]